MSSRNSSPQRRSLTGERAIRWVLDSHSMDYCRMNWLILPDRDSAPVFDYVEPLAFLVAYAVLTPDCDAWLGDPRCSGYLRRVFWISSFDRALDPFGMYETGSPEDAVDPETIRPNKAPARLTPRARPQSRLLRPSDLS